ncbi:acyl-CoA--sterol O-acyltransferase 1-like [Silene latifolia]|uniref:acyl-CoA--sterol O-acyltransferase 1-like n=1 Tax=Silene latifolia TaxID=37657 RepID=UPI003D778BD0
MLPVISLFLVLPLNLTSNSLYGVTSFFISWLANFKLLLFVFGKPPLSLNSPITILHFVVVASFPIALKSDQCCQDTNDSEIKRNPISDNVVLPLMFFLRNYITKGAFLVLLFWKLHYYSYYIHLIAVCLIYLMLKLFLGCAASLSRFLLGIELEPQFNDPLSTTSLQDFWGKRWNLMVTNILRPTIYLIRIASYDLFPSYSYYVARVYIDTHLVIHINRYIVCQCNVCNSQYMKPFPQLSLFYQYQPSREIFIKIIGRKLATYPAVMTTFMVSAIMHELIFYHIGQVRPTVEVTWFFLTHGFLVCLEIAAKKHVAGKWEVPRLISGPLTLSVVLVSGSWLFLRPLLATGAVSRTLQDYAAVVSYLRSMRPGLWEHLCLQNMFSWIKTPPEYV